MNVPRYLTASTSDNKGLSTSAFRCGPPAKTGTAANKPRARVRAPKISFTKDLAKRQFYHLCRFVQFCDLSSCPCLVKSARLLGWSQSLRGVEIAIFVSED